MIVQRHLPPQPRRHDTPSLFLHAKIVLTLEDEKKKLSFVSTLHFPPQLDPQHAPCAPWAVASTPRRQRGRDLRKRMVYRLPSFLSLPLWRLIAKVSPRAKVFLPKDSNAPIIILIYWIHTLEFVLQFYSIIIHISFVSFTPQFRIRFLSKVP